MDIPKIVQLVIGMFKRPDSYLLFLSFLCFLAVDAVWSQYRSPLFSQETVVCLILGTASFAGAAIVAHQREDHDAWTEFGAGLLTALIVLVSFSETWLFGLYVAGCLIMVVLLGARKGATRA